MRCPLCKTKTKVVNSREVKEGTRRRHECPECFTRFSTTETLEIQSLDKHLQERLLRENESK